MAREPPGSVTLIMGGKRSPIRSRSIRWRPGRYRPRKRSRAARPQPYRPVKDTLIAVASGLVTSTVTLLISVPISANFHVPLFAVFGMAMLLIALATGRMAGRDPAGRAMAVVILVFGLVAATALYASRDDLRLSSPAGRSVARDPVVPSGRVERDQAAMEPDEEQWTPGSSASRAREA